MCGGSALKLPWPHRNRQTYPCQKVKDVNYDPFFLCAGNLPLEVFTTSVGEGRGREKAMGGPRPPLGCPSARVHRSVAPIAEPPLRLAGRPCILAWPSAPAVEPLLHLRRCSHRSSARDIVACPHLPVCPLRVSSVAHPHLPVYLVKGLFASRRNRRCHSGSQATSAALRFGAENELAGAGAAVPLVMCGVGVRRVRRHILSGMVQFPLFF